MLTFTKHLRPNPEAIVSFTLPMTADDRTRSRHRFETETGEKLHLSLPRGTVLRDRDLLQSEDGSCLVLVSAKPESVLTARAFNCAATDAGGLSFRKPSRSFRSCR